MGTCKLCGKSGWLTKVSDIGLCNICDYKVKSEVSERLRVTTSSHEVIEKSKKLDELSETVTKLNERLEKLEKGDQEAGKTANDGKTADEGKKVDEIAESVKKVDERLVAVEKGIAESKQPGEDGEIQNRTQEEKDVFAGAIFPDRI